MTRESRRTCAYLIEDGPELLFRLEPTPDELWQELFAEALEGATIQDAAAAELDQYLLSVEKAPDSDSTERAQLDHIIEAVDRLVRATTAQYRSLQDDPGPGFWWEDGRLVRR